MRYFAFGNIAFNNKVVKTDDGVIVETTYVSALPKANRRSLGLLLGTRWGKQTDDKYILNYLPRRMPLSRSVTWSQRLMLCIIGRHVPPLSQNQTDKVLVYYWGPDGECGRTLRVYFWVPRLKANR